MEEKTYMHVNMMRGVKLRYDIELLCALPTMLFNFDKSSKENFAS